MSNINEFEKILPVNVDIDKLQTVFNQVVVEFKSNENETTASGIYAPNMSAAETQANFANRKGIVVKVPKYLYYNPEDGARSMRWKTDMDLKVGDEVWLNYATINDYQYKSGNKRYRTVLYEDVIVAKRGDEVIMLNGYLLLAPHYITKKVLNYEKKEIDKNYGTIAYIGKPNEAYTVPEYVRFTDETVYRSDPAGLKKGDKVIINKNAKKKLRMLEYDVFYKFDGNPYFIAQRYMIAGTIN